MDNGTPQHKCPIEGSNHRGQHWKKLYLYFVFYAFWSQKKWRSITSAKRLVQKDTSSNYISVNISALQH